MHTPTCILLAYSSSEGTRGTASLRYLRYLLSKKGNLRMWWVQGAACVVLLAGHVASFAVPPRGAGVSPPFAAAAARGVALRCSSGPSTSKWTVVKKDEKPEVYDAGAVRERPVASRTGES